MSRNHLLLNMILGIIVFGWFFISFNSFWYCENPSTIYTLSSNSTTVGSGEEGSRFVNDKTCYTLLTVRTYWSEDSEYIWRNVAHDWPDMDKNFPKRKQICSSRKVLVIAGVGFLIIKSLGLIMYVYAFIKIYWWCFNIRIRMLKIKWEIMNSLAFLVLISSIVFWMLWSGVITSGKSHLTKYLSVSNVSSSL